ncbi:MAG TPA: LysM domain-containing protein [Clostridiales bacterium]|nr:LysM domain-containing protein [Clostridiales bacterium]
MYPNIYHNNRVGIIPYVLQPNDNLWLLAQRYNTTVYDIAAANPGIDFNFLQAGQLIYIRPGFGQYSTVSNIGTPETPVCGINKKELNLINYLRMLWEEHVT